jgi:hypothetical protein
MYLFVFSLFCVSSLVSAVSPSSKPIPLTTDTLTFEDLNHFVSTGLLDDTVVKAIQAAIQLKQQALHDGLDLNTAYDVVDDEITKILSPPQSEGGVFSSIWSVGGSALSTAFSVFTLANFLFLIAFLSLLFAVTLIGSVVWNLFGPKVGILLTELAATIALFALDSPLHSRNLLALLNLMYILHSFLHVITIGILFHTSSTNKTNQRKAMDIVLGTLLTVVSLFFFGFFVESRKDDMYITQWVACIVASLIFSSASLFFTSPTSSNYNPQNETLIRAFFRQILLPTLISLIPITLVLYANPITNTQDLTDNHIMAFLPFLSLIIILWPSYTPTESEFGFPNSIGFFLSLLVVYHLRHFPFSLWFGIFTFYHIMVAAVVLAFQFYLIAICERIEKHCHLSPILSRHVKKVVCLLFTALDLSHSLPTCPAIAFTHYETDTVFLTDCLFGTQCSFLLCLFYDLFSYSNTITSGWTSFKADSIGLSFLATLPIAMIVFVSIMSGINQNLITEMSFGPLTMGIILSLVLVYVISTLSYLIFCQIFNYRQKRLQNDITIKRNNSKVSKNQSKGQSTIQSRTLTETITQWCILCILIISLLSTFLIRFLSLNTDSAQAIVVSFGHWFTPKAENLVMGNEVDMNEMMILYVLTTFRYMWLVMMAFLSVITFRISFTFTRPGFDGIACVISAMFAFIFLIVIFPSFYIPALLSFGGLSFMYFATKVFLKRPLKDYEIIWVLFFHGILCILIGIAEYFYFPSLPTPPQIPSLSVIPWSFWSSFWLWEDPFRYHYYAYHHMYFWPFFTPYYLPCYHAYPFFFDPTFSLFTSLLFLAQTGIFRASFFTCGLATFHSAIAFKLHDNIQSDNANEKEMKGKLALYLDLFCNFLLLIAFLCDNYSLIALSFLLTFSRLLYEDRANSPLNWIKKENNRLMIALSITSLVGLLYKTPGDFQFIPSLSFFLVLNVIMVIFFVDIFSRYSRPSKKHGVVSHFIEFICMAFTMVLGFVVLQMGRNSHLSWGNLWHSMMTPLMWVWWLPIPIWPLYPIIFLFEIFYSLLFWIPFVSTLISFVSSYTTYSVVEGTLTWIPGICILFLSLPKTGLLSAVMVSALLLIARAMNFEIAYLAALLNLWTSLTRYWWRISPNSQFSQLSCGMFLSFIRMSILVAAGFLARSHLVVLLAMADFLIVALRILYIISASVLRSTVLIGLLTPIGLVMIGYLALKGAIFFENLDVQNLLEETVGKVIQTFVPVDYLEFFSDPTRFEITSNWMISSLCDFALGSLCQLF